MAGLGLSASDVLFDLLFITPVEVVELGLEQRPSNQRAHPEKRRKGNGSSELPLSFRARGMADCEFFATVLRSNQGANSFGSKIPETNKT